MVRYEWSGKTVEFVTGEVGVCMWQNLISEALVGHGWVIAGVAGRLQVTQCPPPHLLLLLLENMY